MLRVLIVAALLLTTCPRFVLFAPAVEQEVIEKEKSREKDAEKERAPEPTAPVVTSHKVTIAGKEISYTATAGKLPIVNDAGETGAEIFYVAYSANSPSNRQRPLVFAFNGGPGAAAVWLHLGALGPRRVQMLPDGTMPQPPYRVVDNGSSWLDLADLVFVDPVGTGYSRASKPDATKNYTNVQTDIDTLGRFVRLYLTRNRKWDAPIFLVGESYGTFRVAGIAENLAEHGVALNGIVLVSTVLNMQTLNFDFGNDLPYSLYLPSYTATAWYYKKLAPELQQDLQKTLAEAEAWSAGPYLQALFKGDALCAQERHAVAQELARLTGLSESLVQDLNLRIDNRTFSKELLRDSRRMVGFMDTRFNAPNLDLGGRPGFDATVAGIRPPYTSVFNSYARNELRYSSDLEYFVLGGGIGHWDWQAKNSYADTSENLRDTLAKNPYLKLFVAQGLFDMATPHLAAEYTLNHMGLTPRLRENITVRRYEAGHMMYLDEKSLVQLKRDVAEFFANGLPMP